jgi:tetratricopeptide (TPR) repeat protein
MTIGKRGGLVAAAAAAILASGFGLWHVRHVSTGPEPAAAYIGSEKCAQCHLNETSAWRRSQHAAAMASASDDTVLGRFDDATFEYAGVTSTFFRRNGKYYVRTDDANGQLGDFEVKYTFGVAPLQQYLIPLPGGRLQALGIAWDSRPSSAGGQRWFHLYPQEAVKGGDPLHWTGSRQNWNFMCADCHATNLQKGYDPGSRTFDTTFSEMGVGCESCHGAGSAHAAAAGRGVKAALPVRLDERRSVQWTLDAVTNQPTRSQARTTDREIEVCARCHSRRSQIVDAPAPGEPFENAFRPSLIEPALFHSDGQQKDEVYNYASFLQSRMYASGVTCSDCHDPHDGRPRVQGNALCTRCHSAGAYDSARHHFHESGTPGGTCVSCHMPPATFMAIDERHDHSFRVPRPDLTMSLGVPSACTSSCHQTQGAAWAANQIQRRTGRLPGGYQRFAETFAAAERRAPGTVPALVGIATDREQPAIVRASALERMVPLAPGDPSALAPLLDDPAPMVRRAAVSALGRADGQVRVRLLSPLLRDPIRSVRIQSAIALADLADASLTGDARANFEHAFDEFVAEQRFNADRPEAQTNLGQILLQRHRIDEAVAAFQEAIRLDATFVAAYIDLADAHRVRQNEPSAERALRDAIRISPLSAPAHHALGLTLVRQRRLAEAIRELDRAASLEPATSQYAYVYAVALHDTGKAQEAISVLNAAAGRDPDDREILLALALYLNEAGRTAEARRRVGELLAIDPNDADARALASTLGERR